MRRGTLTSIGLFLLGWVGGLFLSWNLLQLSMKIVFTGLDSDRPMQSMRVDCPIAVGSGEAIAANITFRNHLDVEQGYTISSRYGSSRDADYRVEVSVPADELYTTTLHFQPSAGNALPTWLIDAISLDDRASERFSGVCSVWVVEFLWLGGMTFVRTLTILCAVAMVGGLVLWWRMKQKRWLAAAGVVLMVFVLLLPMLMVF